MFHRLMVALIAYFVNRFLHILKFPAYRKEGKLQIKGFTAACPYVLKLFNFGSGEPGRRRDLLLCQIEGFQILRNLAFFLRCAFL